MRIRVLVVAALMAIVIAACSDSSESPSVAVGEVDTTDPAADDMQDNDHAVENVEAPTQLSLPVTDDPCDSPAAHAIGETVVYEVEILGEMVPMAVEVGSSEALESGLMDLVMHGAGVSWQVSADFRPVDAFLGSDWPAERRVLVAPQAEPGETPFWSQTASFNVDYVAELFPLLEKSFCLEDMRVVARSVGQGSLAVSEALCAASYPVDVHLMVTGLLKVAECAGTTQPAIISVDQFEYSPIIGHHWDGEWNPPGAGEAAVTGGLQATPQDLATVAEQYGCSDEAVEESFDLPGLERDAIALTYTTGCAASLHAYGLPAAPDGIGWSETALESIQDRLRGELGAALG